jgi:hypothetical protein
MIINPFYNDETFAEKQDRIRLKTLSIKQKKHKETCLKNKLNRRKKRK